MGELRSWLFIIMNTLYFSITLFLATLNPLADNYKPRKYYLDQYGHTMSELSW